MSKKFKPHPAALRAAESINNSACPQEGDFPTVDSMAETITREYEPTVEALTSLLEVLSIPEEAAPLKVQEAINKAMEAVKQLTKE